MELSRSSQQLLNRALISLSAWHVLESLAYTPTRRLSLAMVIATTGLDVTDVQQAIALLSKKRLLRVDRHGDVAMVRSQADALTRLVEAVASDRALHLATIKQAARRECAAGRDCSRMKLRVSSGRLGCSN